MPIFTRATLLLIVVFTICRCNNEAANNDVVDTSHLGAGTIDQKDSINVPADADMEMKDIIDDYVKGYHTTLLFDSTYISNGDTIKVDFKHYCVFDSAIIIPHKYVSIYGPERFVTHNFESALRIKNGDRIVVDTIIQKAQFDSYLDEYLRDYGILSYPEIKVKDKVLNINYSVSIPLTEVGVRMEMKINSQGAIQY